MESACTAAAAAQDGWNRVRFNLITLDTREAAEQHWIYTRHEGSHLRAHTLGPGGNGSLEGLLLSQAPITEAMMVEVKGDGHTCTAPVVISSFHLSYMLCTPLNTAKPVRTGTACALTTLQALGWTNKGFDAHGSEAEKEPARWS